MQAATNVLDLCVCHLQISSKHKYLVVNVHHDERHYLTFHVRGIGQVESTRMPQRARISSFTFNELMNIVLGPILAAHLKLSLLHRKITHELVSLAFYMDNIFGAFKTYHEKYISLRDHFFPRTV